MRNEEEGIISVMSDDQHVLIDLVNLLIPRSNDNLPVSMGVFGLTSSSPSSATK